MRSVRCWGARLILAALVVWVGSLPMHAANRLFWGGHRLLVAEFAAQLLLLLLFLAAVAAVLVLLVREAVCEIKGDES